MLLLALCVAGLAPGVATAWLVHRRHGWALAVAAGIGVTVSLPGLLILALLAMPPLAVILGLVAGLAAVNAYDRGSIWVATAYAGATFVCLWCAGAGWAL